MMPRNTTQKGPRGLMEHQQENPEAENLDRLYGLVGDLAASRSGGARKRTLLVIYRGLKLVEAHDLSAERQVQVEWMGTKRLDLLAMRHGYDRVLALDESAPSRILSGTAGDARPGDVNIGRAGALYRGLAREWRRTVFTYPAGPRRLPSVSDKTLQRAVGLLVPDGSVLMLVITSEGRRWASLVLGNMDGELRPLTSLGALGIPEIGRGDGAIDEAADMLGERLGAAVFAVSIERDALDRIASSRFHVTSALWAINTGSLRLARVPWRLKLLALLLLIFWGQVFSYQS
jgi:hypothetical protein